MNVKVVRLGLELDRQLVYYVKDGDVWAKPIRGGGRGRKIAAVGVAMDTTKYVYFVDDEGDIVKRLRKPPPAKREAKRDAKRPRKR